MAEKLTRKRAIVAAALSLALVLPAGAGAVWALDRFVIQHVEITDVAAYEAENSTVATVDATSEAVTTATTYQSDTASISISTRSSPACRPCSARP